VGVRTLAALAVVLLAGLAATAFAGIEKKNFTVHPGSTEGGAAKCSGNEVPAAGGFSLDQQTNELYPQTTYPRGPRWKVEAYNLNGPDAYDGSAYALCLKDSTLFVRSKKQRVKDVSGQAQATAKCPGGSKAVSGGGKGPGDNAIMRGSFPAGGGESWGARYENVSTGDRIEAFAICDPSPGGTTFVEDSVTFDPPRRRGLAVTASAECESGEKIVGGGFYSTSHSTNYLESRPTKRAWHVAANADEGVTVVAYGVCQG
jgi:hypothetical protein